MAGLSERERKEVIKHKASLDAARRVWEPLATERKIYQNALDNIFPGVMPGTPEDPATEQGTPGPQVNVNLVARVVAYIKSKCHDNSPEIRISGMRDEDMLLSNMNEHLVARVMERGGAPQASRQAIDDMATLGAWILWLGVDSFTVDHERLAGFATDPVELVLAAAQGADVHPLPGMDLLYLASVARNVHAQATFTLTEFQKENLLRLASEAEAMFAEEQEKPQQVVNKKIWYRATPYGTHCLVDPTVWDRQEAKWMARKIVFSVEEFKAWEPFKGAARRNAKPSTLERSSGHEWVREEYGCPEINQCYVVWEIWDRLTMSVHYITEGYDGYLERDSTYPYIGPDGLPAFDDFFPCEWVTPYTHNKPNPTRPLGVPLIAYGFPQQIEVIKFESAILADAKRSARIYEVSPGLNEDTRLALQMGTDGTIVEKLADDMQAGRPTINLLPNGSMGQDKLVARRLATEDFYAMSSVAPSQITGEPIAQTLGQEQLVTRGAGDVQGDIISEIEHGYSNLARKTAILIRLAFTKAQASRYLSNRYVTPLVNQKGEVVEDSPFDQWKVESLDGVDIVASFSTKGASDDMEHINMLMKALQLVLSARDASGLLYKDPKPLMDLLFQRMSLGKVPDYSPSENELKIQAIKQFLQEQMNRQQQAAQPGPNPPGEEPKPKSNTPSPAKVRLSTAKAVETNREVSGGGVKDMTGGSNPPRQN